MPQTTGPSGILLNEMEELAKQIGEMESISLTLQGDHKYELFINSLLKLYTKKITRIKYLHAVVGLIQKFVKCRCVGIRVVDQNGMIPYESYVGFSQDFWEKENWLSLRHDQCACIRVVSGRPEPQDYPVMTPAGSFCCSNIKAYISGLTEMEFSRFRGVCVQVGFQSMAIVPITYRKQIIGAIHMADEREEIVCRNKITHIESIAPIIGEAITRFNLEGEIARQREFINDYVLEHAGEVNIAKRKLEAEILEDMFSVFNDSKGIYKNVISDLKLGLAIINKNLEILSVNEQFKQWFPDVDASEKPLCYKVFRTPPRKSVCTKCPISITLKDNAITESTRSAKINGRIMYYKLRFFPIKYKNNKCALCMAEDVTENILSEKSLILSKERLSKAFNATPNMISITTFEEHSCN